MKLFYLIAYAVIMCMLAISAFRRKENKVYFFMMSAYAFSAVITAVCKVFQELLLARNSAVAFWYDISDTTWWGYATLIICTFIALKPLEYFDKENQLKNFGENSKTCSFFVNFSIVYILVALLFLLLAFREVIQVLNVSDYGTLRNSLYNNSENEETGALAVNFVANICLKLCAEFKLLAVFVSLGMLKKKIKSALAISLLGISFFIYFIECSAQAARGGLLIYLFCVFLISISFYKYLSVNTKRKVRIVAIVLACAVLTFFVAVTTSRLIADNNTRENAFLGNILFYLGHAPLEFSRITGSLTKFAYGRTTVGRLISHYFGTDYSWELISSEIGYPNISALFVTYLGFLYTDFGVPGCIVYTSVLSFAMYQLIKKRPNHISTLYFVTYYINFYVKGIFTVGRLEYASLVTTTLVYFIMRVIERSPDIRRFFTARFVVGRQ